MQRTSGASASMERTRQGSLRTGMSLAPSTTAASMVRSDVGVAVHSSA